MGEILCSVCKRQMVTLIGNDECAVQMICRQCADDILCDILDIPRVPKKQEIVIRPPILNDP